MAIVVLAVVLGVSIARLDWLWTRPGASERLGRLPSIRARATVDRYRRTLTPWEPWMGLALVGPFLVLAVVSGALLLAVLSAGAIALFVVSAALRPRAADAVRQAAAEQGVEPLRGRRHSPTRRRRQRPWGAAALLGLAVAQLGFGLDRLGPSGPASAAVAVGTVGLMVLVVACVVLALVSFRGYADERTA